jgi:hypothetical protein
MIKYLLSSALLVSSFTIWAQQDLTLYELRSVPQSNQLNVSRTPLSSGYLQLPVVSGVYTTVYNQGFNWGDFFEWDGDSSTLNMEQGLKRMKDLNDMGMDLRTNLFGFGFRSGASYFSFNVEHKMSARITYPRSFFELIWYGNADPQYLDQRVSLDGLAYDHMQYTEMSLGISRDLNEKFSVGGRLKYLSGQANYRTTNSKLGITTRSDAYAIQVDGAFAYKSAGAIGASLDSSGQAAENIEAAATGNHGGALDLGITYRHSNRISVSASVNDLGLIMWRSGVYNGTADSVYVEYEGYSVKNWSQENIDEEGVLSGLDSIARAIKFENDREGYNTWLPAKIYLGANYRLFQKTDVSVLSYNEYYNGNFRTSIRVGLTQRVRNWLMATVNYSLYGRSAANVGFGLSVNGGPFQLYMVTDNALAYILPTQTKNFHLRFGVNLTFASNFSQN